MLTQDRHDSDPKVVKGLQLFHGAFLEFFFGQWQQLDLPRSLCRVYNPVHLSQLVWDFEAEKSRLTGHPK